jgi:hypothetical protein
MDSDDVRMIKCRCCFRLLKKAADPLMVRGYVSRKYFQSNCAVKPGINSQVYFAHTACTKLRTNLIMGKAGAFSDGHVSLKLGVDSGKNDDEGGRTILEKSSQVS